MRNSTVTALAEGLYKLSKGQTNSGSALCWDWSSFTWRSGIQIQGQYG